MKYTKPFRDLSKEDAAIAGGKGASLGEMLNSGISVPDGFVVMSSTFDEFIEQTDLVQEIEAVLDSVDHGAIHTVDKASDKIRELIISREIPEGIKNEIMQSFKTLGANFVAVRSSATAEDGADNAWAGQLESYLNVTEKDVLEKVKECWSSLFTARAIFYRFEKDLQLTKISVAVVVQKMVNSEKSGIAFSVHPVTEDRNQLIIEAGYGLGEAIVSGSVTPDSYVVSKSPREIIDINVGSQNKALYRDLKDGGNKWIELDNEKANSQVLSEKEIFEFSEIVIGIENHYGFPCDIEWAYENGKFYIVQSRPITTLKKLTTENDFRKDDKLKLYNEFMVSLNGNEKFTFSGPYSNLAICGVAWSNEKYYKNYYKKSKAFHILSLIKGKETFASIDNYNYRQYAVEYLTRFINKEIRLDDIKQDYDDLDKKINHIYSQEIVDPVQTIKQSYNLLVHLIAATVYIESFDRGVIEEVLDKKINNAVWEKVSSPRFMHFEERWNNLIKKSKSYQEVDFIFMDYYLLPPEKDIEKKWKEMKEKQIEKDDVDREIIMNDEPWMEFTQFAIKLRDVRKDPIAKLQTLFFKSARILYPGIEDSLLAHVNCLEIIDNKLPSVEELIKRRDNGYVLLIRNNDTYEYDHKAYKETKDLINQTNKDVSVIQGVSASCGNYRGFAKIVLDPSESDNFLQGDILVTGMTRPDFVPLMKKAGAIITAEGGVTCHAAIISRELKIPCVIGTKIAVQVLKDGDYVEVDADNGVVRILNKKDDSGVDIRKFKESIKNREYITQQGDISIALLGNICNAIQEEYISVYGYSNIHPILTMQKGSRGICYFDLEMYRDFSRVSYSRIKDSVYNLPEYKDYQRLSKIIDSEYKDFSINKDTNKLKEKILNYFEIAKKYLVSSLYCEAVDHQIVKELAEKSKVKNIEKFIEISILPTRPSFINHQNKLLLEGGDISWSFTNYFSSPTNEERLDLLNKKRKELHKKETEDEIKNTENKSINNQKLVNELMKECSDEQKRVVEFVQASINIRDERKEFILKLFTMLSDLLRNLAERYNIPYGLISTISDDEINKLDDSSFLEILKERYGKGVAMISSNNKPQISIVDYELSKNIIFDNLVIENNNICGISANKGFCKGIVKIITSVEDFHIFQEGEVLVTGMTRAEYVPLMRKAGAIITDEGGVTCHAAIISRELDIPCIIATKIATQVLKDGDLVEVDADNGVVRIIK